MARTLVSPGVSVSVTDESFYAPAGTGTVPLLVIATAQDKRSPDGTGTAAYTTAAEAANVKLITSQRDLLTNYGNPIFKTSGGTALHGHELNEYGLLAAYSFLGIANRAYILRADMDLDQLAASSVAPAGDPADGTYWLDSASTVWGLKRWSGTAWVRQTVKSPAAGDLEAGNVPKSAYGFNGDYAVVYFTTTGTTAPTIKFYHKIAGTWYHIGSASWDSASSADYQEGSYLNLPSTRSGGGSLVAGDLMLQKESQNNGTTLSVKVYDSAAVQFTAEEVLIRDLSYQALTAYNSNPAEGALWADTVTGEATLRLKRWNGEEVVTATQTSAMAANAVVLANHANKISLAFTFGDGTPVNVTFTSGNVNATVDNMVTDLNNAFSGANATLSRTSTAIAANVSGLLTITNSDGYDIVLSAGNVAGFDPNDINFNVDLAYSNWENLSYEVSGSELTGDTANGTLWYNDNITPENIDLLYNDGGDWVTYNTDVQVSPTEPTTRSNGVTALSGEEIWIDSSDLENYPRINYYDGDQWILLDNTDQVTDMGVVFADFRVDPDSSLDADAPSGAEYPNLILGWNTRYSGGNVKQWVVGHTHEGVLVGDRWVNYSGNKSDGSPHMLRKAQRRSVVKQMQAAIASNTDIRNEVNRFNLIAAPGYPELLDEMISLNVDRKETAFIVADAPLRLAASSTATQAWATNSNNAEENGEDGLVSSNAYAAVYYPHGLTTNLDGVNVVVPASHIALRTLAYNDNVAFPWFAPAGFQRGIVTNATGLGYINADTAEFVSVALSEGQRDSLYINKLNPISNFPGRGIAVFGQKTLNPTASALDRINVARLVVYIRERLDDIVKPFLFEPNDEVTRQNAKVVVDRFLGQLVTQRGLFDFLTVCDTTNNTPARIDRNELHIDVAIQPIKAVEFIYIPIRIQNTLGTTG
jgi:hypothetical protein